MAIQSEVLYAVIAAASAGDNTLVAAAGSGIKIRVVSLVLSAPGGANDIRLESGASGTAILGSVGLADNGQLVLPYHPAGWCETAANALLNLELSAATAVGGVLGYVTVS